jgi:hypothetical protein
VLLPAVPSLKTMVEQLSECKMFEPMIDPVSEIYEELYGTLCEDTHLIPGKTMMGRLMVAGKDPSTVFEPSQEEFGRFLVLLGRVAEIGALAVLNVLEDDAGTDGAENSDARLRKGRWGCPGEFLARVVGLRRRCERFANDLRCQTYRDDLDRSAWFHAKNVGPECSRGDPHGRGNWLCKPSRGARLACYGIRWICIVEGD